MNREQVKPLIPVLEAWSEGKVIQYRRRDVPNAEWTDFVLDDCAFGSCYEHRVKPEPHDIKWAANQMFSGISVRRRAWINASCRCNEDANGYVSFHTDGGVRMDVRIGPEDIVADDWEVYEPK